MIDVENTWDKVSTIYARYNRDYNSFPFNVLKRFKSCYFLEAGSGDGDIAIFMSKKNNCKVVGLEISNNFLKISRDKLKKNKKLNVKFIKGDVRSMPFKNNTFDLIFSGGVVEHFDETIDAIHEHVRVLKSGGKILIGVPCKQGLHYPLKKVMQLFKIWRIGYEKSFTKTEFQKILTESNLKIIEKIYRPIIESDNQHGVRLYITVIISKIDKLIHGTHMQYYLCEKL